MRAPRARARTQSPLQIAGVGKLRTPRRRDCCDRSIGPSGALQDVDDAHAASAHHVAEAGTSGLTRLLPLHLACTRLAAELQCGFPDLRQTGRSAGVSARDQTTVGRHRAAPAELEIAALDAL